jgi:hypothetical protein
VNTYTLSGSITEVVAGQAQPVAGVNVSAWVDQGASGYSYMWAHGATYSDAGGHYRLPYLPAASVTVQIWKDGYVQQCASPTVAVRGDVTLDLGIVARQNLSADPSGVPPAAAGQRVVSGLVFETTPDGRRPLAGAFIDFEPVMDFPAATTTSDAQGRYLLCGLPDQASAELGASFGGRVTFVTAPPRTTGVDIEIPR